MNQIEKLKSQLSKIRSDFFSLLDGKNDDFREAVRFLAEETEKRIDFWETQYALQNEMEEKKYKAQLDCIESDYKKAALEIDNQIFETIKYRYQALQNEFPQFYNYFMSFNTPFKENLINQPNIPGKSYLTLDKSSTRLLTPEEIKNDMNEVNTAKFYEIREGKLMKGDEKYEIGTNIVINLNEFGNFSCVIQEIYSDSIVLLLDGANSLKIPIRNLNMKLAALSKV